MKQQTLKEVLSEDGGIQDDDYRLYLIREGETVLYVGQAKNTYNRLLSHLGLDGRSLPSQVGELILANAPASDNWLFEQYTLSDCRECVLQYRATLPEEAQMIVAPYGDRYDVTAAEEAFIKIHRPCLNAASNPNPLPLPAKLSKGLGHSNLKTTSDYLEDLAAYENPYASSLEDGWGI